MRLFDCAATSLTAFAASSLCFRSSFTKAFQPGGKRSAAGSYSVLRGFLSASGVLGMRRSATDGYGGEGVHYDPPGSQVAAHTMIWMHGLGDTADGWADQLSQVFTQMTHLGVPPFRLILPTAPIRPVTLNMGMPMPAWWDIRDLTKEGSDNIAHLDESTKRIHNIVTKEKEAKRQVFLGGFSQGGALALYAALKSPVAVKGVVGFSTWLPNGDALSLDSLPTKSQLPPIMMCHGASDDVVKYTFGTLTRDTLKEKFNMDVEFHTIPGLSHSVDPSEINHFISFMKKHA